MLGSEADEGGGWSAGLLAGVRAAAESLLGSVGREIYGVTQWR